MKRILIIGIGAGDPEHVTVQAVNALNQVDVFFLLDKGEEKAGLAELRRDIIRRYVRGDGYRVVEAESPAWSRDAGEYAATVDGLNREKRALFERLFAGELTDGERGAFLVWGDPTLYDSTIRIVDAIARDGAHAIEYEVIPGISSVQALAARHRVALNRVGGEVAITTGRRLAAGGFPAGADSVVVMLDADDAYRGLADPDLDIRWGAYVGTPDEILVAGRLGDVADDIARIRAQARRDKGWIMDTYLLRRRARGRGDG